MPVAADRFGGLQVVLDLAEIGVGVAIVHQGVQVFERLPDPHFGFVEAGIFAALRGGEIMRLVGVIQAVKLAHAGCGVGVIAKIPGLAIRIVALLNEFVPLLEILKRAHRVPPVTRITAGVTRENSQAGLQPVDLLSQFFLAGLSGSGGRQQELRLAVDGGLSVWSHTKVPSGCMWRALRLSAR